MLTPSQVREIFHYDPESGVFTRAKKVGRSTVVGSHPGHLCTKGYLKITASGKQYAAHRLAWAYMTGAWPEHQIDHINCIRSDNRWANLREATAALNNENKRTAPITSRSGLLGASYRADGDFYQARITTAGKQQHLGVFKTAEAAHEAYLAAKRRLHEGCTI